MLGKNFLVGGVRDAQCIKVGYTIATCSLRGSGWRDKTGLFIP